MLFTGYRKVNLWVVFIVHFTCAGFGNSRLPHGYNCTARYTCYRAGRTVGFVDLMEQVLHGTIGLLCSTICLGRFFANIIGLPGHRNKRKSVLEITKMYYF